MTKHAVLAEFIDSHTGERILPGGDPFAPHDKAQYNRLVAAACINSDAAPDLSKALGDMSREELELAAAEAFRGQLPRATDDDLRGLIQRHRAGDDDDDDDGLAKQKIDDLKALAVTEEIDLGDSTRKDDIVAAIRKARAEGATA